MSEDNLNHFDFYRRAKSHEKQGRYDEALSAYSKALQLNNDYAHAWYYKAKLHFKMGQYNECLDCAEKAKQLAPDWADHCNQILTDARSKIGR